MKMIHSVSSLGRGNPFPVIQCSKLREYRFFEFFVLFCIFLELQVLEDRNLVQMYRHPSTSYIWNKMSLKVKLSFYFSLYCVHTFRSVVQKVFRTGFPHLL